MWVAVRKGADSPNPPQERGLLGRSHADEAAPTVQHVTSGECLGRASVGERRTSLGCSSVPSGMYCSLCGEGNVLQRHGTPDKAGAMFWQCTV